MNNLRRKIKAEIFQIHYNTINANLKSWTISSIRSIMSTNQYSQTVVLNIHQHIAQLSTKHSSR